MWASYLNMSTQTTESQGSDTCLHFTAIEKTSRHVETIGPFMLSSSSWHLQPSNSMSKASQANSQESIQTQCPCDKINPRFCNCNIINNVHVTCNLKDDQLCLSIVAPPGCQICHYCSFFCSSAKTLESCLSNLQVPVGFHALPAKCTRLSVQFPVQPVLPYGAVTLGNMLKNVQKHVGDMRKTLNPEKPCYENWFTEIQSGNPVEPAIVPVSYLAYVPEKSRTIVLYKATYLIGGFQKHFLGSGECRVLLSQLASLGHHIERRLVLKRRSG